MNPFFFFFAFDNKEKGKISSSLFIYELILFLLFLFLFIYLLFCGTRIKNQDVIMQNHQTYFMKRVIVKPKSEIQKKITI